MGDNLKLFIPYNISILTSICNARIYPFNLEDLSINIKLYFQAASVQFILMLFIFEQSNFVDILRIQIVYLLANSQKRSTLRLRDSNR